MTYKTPRLREIGKNLRYKDGVLGRFNNEDDVNCGNTNLNEDFIVAVHSDNFNFINCKFTLKNLRDSEPMASAYVSAAVYFQLVLLN